MPAIQTSYTATHAVAYEGQVADIGPNTIISRTVANAAMGFGKVAVQGTAAQSVRAPTTGVTNFVGITVRDQGTDPALPNQMRVGDTVNVLTYGAIWVLAGEAVAEGDPVYFVPTTGVLNKTASSNILVAGARWDTAAASGALARLRFL
jgi:hypothetical protein